MRLVIYLILSISCTDLLAVNFNNGDHYALCFTPAEHCKRKITDYIYAAKHSIEVQAYSFTSKGIAYALVNAQRRGVQVRVLVDKSELVNYSRLNFLLQHRVPLWVDTKVRIAHNKVMIFDKQAVLTGSYNFTNGAEYHNAENSLYIYAPKLAARYVQNWLSRKNLSTRLSKNNLASLTQQARTAGAN
jgi:phosphatidylserine/phosphatidylglycerophosphate/cardiolipin synthase-like enzyme